MLWVLKWRESEGRLNDCHTFLLLSVLKIRENGEHLSSYYTCSNAFGLQVKRKSRASQLFLYFFYCFWSSSQEKVKDVSAILIVFLLLRVLKSRESEGPPSYNHTFQGRPWVKSGLFWLPAPPKKLLKTRNKVRRAFHRTSFRPLILAKHVKISVNHDEEANSNQAHFGGSFFYRGSFRHLGPYGWFSKI